MARRAWRACAAAILAGSLACAGAAPAPTRDPAIEVVHVEGGCFRMGSPDGALGGPEEKPAHEVCVGAFDIGRYEVTQEQWAAVMGTSPAHHRRCGGRCPVEMVSWDDVQRFLARLGERGGAAWRLPTEAEWEYAARGGGRPDRYSGADDDVGSVGWYTGNSEGVHPVGTRAPNALGLHDMSGNVWEWTGDWYDAGYYAASPRDDPRGPREGERRVVRGGSFADDAVAARVFYRNHLPPDYRSPSKGFRVVRVPAPPR